MLNKKKSHINRQHVALMHLCRENDIADCAPFVFPFFTTTQSDRIEDFVGTDW